MTKQTILGYVPDHKNLIINGGFTVNQRLAVSGSALSAGVYGHDRWKAGASGGTYTFTQSDGPTPITITAGSLIQVIESKNVQGGTYILSWSGTATARVGLNSATPSGSYVASPILITGQTAGTGMSIEFTTGTVGQVKLEAGNLATPYTHKTYAEELRDCLRFCTVIRGDCLPNNSIRVNTNAIETIIPFPVEMRAAPSLTHSSPSWVAGGVSGNQITCLNYTGPAWVAITGALSITVVSASTKAGVLTFTAGTSFDQTSGNTGRTFLGNTVYLIFSAEL